MYIGTYVLCMDHVKIRGLALPTHQILERASRCVLTLGRDRSRGHAPDLLDQELALINELLVVGSVFQELRQEGQQLVPIHNQDFLDRNRLVRVGHKDLEDVEAFVLHHFAVVAQQVHADLEMFSSVNVLRHDVIVGSVQQDFAQKLDGLPFGDIAVRLHQYAVVFVEKELKVHLQVSWNEVLVLSQEFLIRKRSVRANNYAAFKGILTRKVVNASAATSNEPLSIHSKNRQKIPFPVWGLSLSMPMIPWALDPGSSPSSYSMMAAAASLLMSSRRTEPAGVALSLWS